MKNRRNVPTGERASARAMTTIAFVTPWYGPDIPGGAEAEARRTAEQLHQAGLPVEVLTTCIRDFHGDWGKNSHRPGLERVNGVPVRRFPVKRRDRAAFDAVNWRLMHGLPITPAQEQTYIGEMIKVPALYEHIRRHARDTLFIFIPYMFATTYYGAQICPERSLVIPCLHDESYARLGLYRELLPAVRGLIFHSQAEADLALSLYGPAQGQLRRVLGEGVDSDFQADGARFRHRFGIEGPFLLYAGRREPGKNTPLLLGYWRRFRQQSGRALSLVLMGSGSVAAGPEDGVIDLGFVSAPDKYDAYAAASLFVMPSVHESFSLVIMESWLAGTPVLVHGACAVTREHVGRANGGLYFDNYAEFAGTVAFLLDHPQVAARLGQQGRRYVLEQFRWEVVIARYRQLINEVLAP